MLSMFRFRRSRGPVDLAIGMTGVRLGERLLHVGPGNPAVFAAAAAKAGLTGRACAVAESPGQVAALEQAAAHEGVFVEVSEAKGSTWPYDAAAFDVVIVDGNLVLSADSHRQEFLLAEVKRVVRPGGRVMTVYFRARGVASRLGFEPAHGFDDVAERLLGVLGRCGFGPARFLAGREGMAFVEAFRPLA
jgi:ubiquinone/menaquinone biosynthesis C-methylase UbiE